MSARPNAWMPLYIGDYLADTMHLTRDQHGAYFLLIMAYWRRGGPLPNDDDQLAAVAKASPAEWRKLRPVMAAFFKIEDGEWHHKRIDAELAEAENNHSVRSKAGAEGAKKRWQTHGKAMTEPLANRVANAQQNDAPSPSPISSLRSDSSVASDEATAARPPPDDPVKAVFDRGLAIYQAAGIPEDRARKLIGKQRSEFGNARMLSAIARCEAEIPSDPVAFMAAILGQMAQGRVFEKPSFGAPGFA